MKNGKYFIVLFCNKKKVKILHRCQKKTTIYEYWREFRTERPPRFLKTQGMKRNTEVLYELALIFPNNRWSTKTFVKDSLGRLMEAKMENEKLRIKEIVPYWKEELIYDFQQKKRIRYHEMFDEILKVTEIGQVFTLNNKLFIQNDNNIKLYGNKLYNVLTTSTSTLKESVAYLLENYAPYVVQNSNVLSFIDINGKVNDKLSLKNKFDYTNKTQLISVKTLLEQKNRDKTFNHMVVVKKNVSSPDILISVYNIVGNDFNIRSPLK